MIPIPLIVYVHITQGLLTSKLNLDVANIHLCILII